MKYIEGIYEYYFEAKDIDEDEAKKISEDKWYNLVVRERIEYFNDVLKAYEWLSQRKVYEYIKEFHELITSNVDSPLELVDGKKKIDFFDKSLNVMCQEMDDKAKDDNLPRDYYALLQEFNSYFDIIEKWQDFVLIEQRGQELLGSVTFGDWQQLSDLVNDIEYYNSVRSNPELSHIEESRGYLKSILKTAKIRKKKLTEVESDIFYSYCRLVKDYLDDLTYLIETKNKKIKKSRKSKKK